MNSKTATSSRFHAAFVLTTDYRNRFSERGTVLVEDGHMAEGECDHLTEAGDELAALNFLGGGATTEA
ncbi:hypothetical protein [Halorussus sp. MSC15.2]|uniref:hypothetical protein n=1 Tax=Halorussus sp. MSC15.2 TaxID=2283638 RepID=UPI001966D472|nr:hypothetical protein [Halorussus sp. MSC15.2]